MSATIVAGFTATTNAEVLIGTASTIIAGWFQPTTLTAGRYYWECGQFGAIGTGLSVASTTSQLSLTIRRSTQNRVLSTTNAGITANAWHFIAVNINGQGTVTESIWVGTETAIPVKTTTTVSTAGAGNLTAINELIIGSSASISNPFQGRISQMTTITTQQNTNNVAPDDQYLFTRFIYPLYLGSFDRQRGTSINGFDLNDTQRGGIKFFPFDSSIGSTIFHAYELSTGANGTQNAAITYQTSTSTSTFSAEEPRAARFNAGITNGLRLSPTSRR